MQSARRDLAIQLFLIATTAAVFAQVRSHDFLNYDDSDYVTLNPQVQAGLGGEGLAWALTTFHAGNWFPLTWLSHMLDVELFGLDPGGHHATSALLHALNAVLLFRLLRRATRAAWRSALVAALFALHPLHVESVAWVAERKDVLSGLFFLLTTGAYLRYCERPGAGRYAAVAGLFALGLSAKPMVVTLPFALLLLDYWPLGRLAGGAPVLARRVAEKLPLLALAAASSAATLVAQWRGGAVSSLENLSLADRAAAVPVAYAAYLIRTLWPAHLSVLYPHPVTFPAWQVGGSLLLLAVATALCLRWARRLPYLPVGWLWFLGTLVPVIGLVQVGAQHTADRYTYLPLIGLFLMAAWGAADLSRGWRYRRPLRALAAGLVLVAAGACSWWNVQHWRDSVTLFEHSISAAAGGFLEHPPSPVLHHNLGSAYTVRPWAGFLAVRHLRLAIGLGMDEAPVHDKLGGAYHRLGAAGEAIKEYRRAIELDPSRASAHFHLAKLLLEIDRPRSDPRPLEEYLRLRPRDAEGRVELAALLARRGEVAQAIRLLEQALHIEPGMAGLRARLGAALLVGGDYERAASHLEAALRERPTAQTHVQLAAAHWSLGDSGEAIRHGGEALRRAPDWARPARDLAWMLATTPDPALRDPARALELAERAAADDRAEPRALDVLAAAQAAAGRFGEAAELAARAVLTADSRGEAELAGVIRHRESLYRRGEIYVSGPRQAGSP